MFIENTIKQRIKQAFNQAVNSYDGVADLQRNIAQQLSTLIISQPIPEIILELGCGSGLLTKQLLTYLPQNTQLIGLDIAENMLKHNRQQLAHSTIDYLCADAEFLPIKNQSINWIVSNLTVQWCQQLSETLIEFKRILKPKGRLLLSTFTENTLQELVSAWREVDYYQHVNHFHNISEWQQLLEAAGYQRIHLTKQSLLIPYPSVIDLLRELKALGANTVTHHRNPKLITATQLQQMIKAYSKNSSAENIVATFEILFIEAEI
ncbi:MAG: hypothetical protein RL637_850 [Pseudomonadota bacterium]